MRLCQCRLLLTRSEIRHLESFHLFFQGSLCGSLRFQLLCNGLRGITQRSHGAVGVRNVRLRLGDEALKLPHPHRQCGLRANEGLLHVGCTRDLSDGLCELIHDGAEAHLGARRAELTIFFSDIEGFTSIAESTTPEGLAADLADYFATITGTILESGGTVDKYIGDCVMAFWGAPRAVPDHAARAVETSLRVRGRLAELNARRAAEGRPPIVTRIGLSTGEVVVGNFGYEARMNYTVMGDTVNLSSRLEGLNKYVGTTLLVSESTMVAAKGAILGRLLGAVAVKGKREGVRIWEPLAMRAEADATLVTRVGEWNAAVERFMAQEFEAALPVFEAWAARHPDDEPASQKIEACRQFISLPPEPTWNGTVVMNTK